MAAIFQTTFSNGFCENALIPIKVSLKFVPKGPINNIPTLIESPIVCHLVDANPLSEPMMAQVINAYMCHSSSMS